MCFRFGACFGSGSGQDYGRSTSKTTHHGYYSGTDHKSGPLAYHRQPANADEAGWKAGAGGRKDHVDNAGGHGAYAQDKSDDTLKHATGWNGKVVDDAGHTYTERLYDAAPNHRKHTADYHQYQATTTTTLARY